MTPILFLLWLLAGCVGLVVLALTAGICIVIVKSALRAGRPASGPTRPRERRS